VQDFFVARKVYMQNRENLTHLLLTLGLALGVASIPVGAAYAQAVEAGNGSVELGNTSDSADQTPAAAEASAVTGTDAQVDSAEVKPPPKDPREAYRDQVMKQASEETGATSAVSRRYKKVDKATYNELLQSGAFQPAQPAQ
jgi:hypothetical protein